MKMQFLGNDPGAVHYGNFINYYSFHPAEARLSCLPEDIWTPVNREKYICLDIGCNTGELTEKLYNFLKTNTLLKKNSTKCKILGIDIDPALIERAKEISSNKEHIQFECCDIMDNESNVLYKHLSDNNVIEFDVIFLFSVTMWIHLNYGDRGLETLIKKVSALTRMIVIEPQSWQCYKNAVKRVKRKGGSFPLLDSIQWRENVLIKIRDILESENFVKIEEKSCTWNRSIIIYKKDDR